MDFCVDYKIINHIHIHISNGDMSRVEGIMNTSKINGKLKFQMESWNLFQIVKRFVNLACIYDAGKCKIIKDFVKTS